VFEPDGQLHDLKGRQSLKFGVLVRYYQWIGYDSSNYAGIFNFTGIETQNPTATPANPHGGRCVRRLSCSAILRQSPALILELTFGGQRWYHQYFAQDDIR